MGDTVWLRAKELFEAARRLDGEARERFLSDAAAGDPEAAAIARELFVGWTEEAPRAEAASLAAALRGLPATEPSDRAAAADVSGAPDLPTPGTTLAGRYGLRRRLGDGGQAGVFEAEDLVSGRLVAVKVLRGRDEAAEAAHREALVLRFARVPGVVDHLDDGTDDGWTFLVMRLVEGAPFPGTALGGRAASWDALRAPVLRLVEALGRLHWLGILHRDVKPANVLVDGSLGVTIVDLGIAVAPSKDARGAGGAGTRHYMAPEVRGFGDATVQSDLYSVGAMLRDALAGRIVPYGATDPAGGDAPHGPLDPAALAAPPHVRETIARLLDPDPARRPSGAREVAALLRSGTWDPHELPLPFAGDDSLVRAIVEAVRARRPLDIGGRPGSGRSRAVAEAERRLAAEGIRTLRCVPSEEPFASAEPLAGRVPGAPRVSLDAARAWLRRCLRLRLDAGICVAADDWEALDPETRAALAEVRDAGPLVRVFETRRRDSRAAPGGGGPEPLSPPVLTAADLRVFFHGPDSVLHLQEDASLELHRRTGGVPGACVDLLVAWIDAGVARWEGERCQVDRAGIDRLSSGLALAAPGAAGASAPDDADALRVQALLEIATVPLSIDEISSLLSLTPLAAGLAAERAIECDAAGRDHGLVAALARTDAALRWPAAERTRVHRALAKLERLDARTRLYHAVAGDAPDRFERAVAAARAAVDADRPLAAMQLYELAIHATRKPARASEALVGMLDAALAAGTADAADLVMLNAASTRVEPETGDAVLLVARAAYDAVQQKATAAVARIRTSGVCDGPLERQAIIVGAQAARMAGDLAAQREFVERAARWSRRTADSDARGVRAELAGWLRYAELRFEEAARWHSVSAVSHLRGLARSGGRAGRRRAHLNATLNAASAWLEAGDVTRAREYASHAEAAARELRMPLAEARAIWMLRSAAYRAGADVPPDPAWCDVAATRLPPRLAALVRLTEAAIAFRAGRQLDAAAHARAARDAFRTFGSAEPAALCDALLVWAGDPPPCGGTAAATSGPGAMARVLRQTQALLEPWKIDSVTEDTALRSWRSQDSVRWEVISAEEAERLGGRGDA